MIFFKHVVSIKTIFFEKKKVTFYSFNGRFQVLHADVANLEFLGKSAVGPKYCLLFVDLYTSRIYTYPVHSKKDAQFL